MKDAFSAMAVGLAGAVGFLLGALVVSLNVMASRSNPLAGHNYQCIHVKSGISKPSMVASIDGAVHTLCLGCEIGYAHLFYKAAVKDGDEQLGRPIIASEVPEPFRNAFKDGS